MYRIICSSNQNSSGSTNTFAYPPNQVTARPRLRKVLISICPMGHDFLKCGPPRVGALLLLYHLLKGGHGGPIIEAEYRAGRPYGEETRWQVS